MMMRPEDKKLIFDGLSEALETHAAAFGELDGRLLVLDTYLDQQCGAWFGGMHRCEYCSGIFVVQDEEEVRDDEDQAGIGSYYYGCENCEGRAGDLARRDD